MLRNVVFHSITAQSLFPIISEIVIAASVNWKVTLHHLCVVHQSSFECTRALIHIDLITHFRSHNLRHSLLKEIRLRGLRHHRHVRLGRSSLRRHVYSLERFSAASFFWKDRASWLNPDSQRTSMPLRLRSQLNGH